MVHGLVAAHGSKPCRYLYDSTHFSVAEDKSRGTVGTIGTGFPIGDGFRDRSYGGGGTVAIGDLLLV